VTAKTANVRHAGPQGAANSFRVTIDDAMLAALQSQPIQEYAYPLPIVALPCP
jgi:hypothetical protein